MDSQRFKISNWIQWLMLSPLIILSILASSASADPSRLRDSISLVPMLEYAVPAPESSCCDLNPENTNQLEWKPVSEDTGTIPYPDREIWMRFRLEPTLLDQLRASGHSWVVATRGQDIRYIPPNNMKVQDLSIVAQDVRGFPRPPLRLVLEPGLHYLVTLRATPISTQVRIQDFNAYELHTRGQITRQALLIAVLLFAVILHLAVGIFLADKLHILLALFGLSTTVVIEGLDPLVLGSIFPDLHFKYFTTWGVTYSALLAATFILLLARSFLRLPVRSPRWNAVAIFGVGAQVVGVIMYATAESLRSTGLVSPKAVATIIMLVNIPIGLGYMLPISAGAAMLWRMREAKWFLLGFSLGLVGMALRHHHFLTGGDGSLALPISDALILAQFILISVALAERLRQHRRARQEREAHHLAELEAIAEEGRYLSECGDLASLVQQINTSISRLIERPDVSVRVAVPAGICGQHEDGDTFRWVRADGSTEPMLRQLESQASWITENRLLIRSPSNNEIIAQIILPFETPVESRHRRVLEALGNNIASAINAVSAAQAHRDLFRSRKDLQTILDNLEEGICVLDEKLMLISQANPQLQRLLAFPEQNREAFLHFLTHSDGMTLDEGMHIQAVINCCFGEPACIFSVNRPHLPQQISISQDAGNREFVLTWSAMLNDSGVTDRFLVTVREVTDLLIARAQARRRETEIERVVQMVSLRPCEFTALSSALNRLLRLIETHAEHCDEVKRDIVVQLHTLKGNARTMGLKEFVTSIHNLENVIKEGADASKLQFASTACQELLAAYTQINSTIFNKKDTEPPRVVTLTEILHQTEIGMIRTAERLLKPRPTLTHSGLDFLVLSGAAAHSLLSAFNHLATNVVDHGFSQETQGQVNIFNLGSDNQHIIIGMESNEDGININQLQERAKEQGLTTDEQTVDLRLLFSHGFSTAKGITEISGRGVGVPAARAALQALGGDLSAEFIGPVNNNGRQPFRWLLRIAQEHVLSLLPYESQHHKKAS